MRACERCEKSFKMGGTRELLRGKHNPTNWGKKKANLQWTRLLVPGSPRSRSGGAGKRSLVCTRCLRTLSKAK